MTLSHRLLSALTRADLCSKRIQTTLTQRLQQQARHDGYLRGYLDVDEGGLFMWPWRGEERASLSELQTLEKEWRASGGSAQRVYVPLETIEPERLSYVVDRLAIWHKGDLPDEYYFPLPPFSSIVGYKTVHPSDFGLCGDCYLDYDSCECADRND